MVKATVSTKGQIAIPKAVREQLNLRPGTQISIDVQGQSLVLKRLVPDLPHWSTMRGMIKDGPDLTKALEEERAAEVARDKARVNQGR